MQCWNLLNYWPCLLTKQGFILLATHYLMKFFSSTRSCHSLNHTQVEVDMLWLHMKVNGWMVRKCCQSFCENLFNIPGKAFNPCVSLFIILIIYLRQKVYNGVSYFSMISYISLFWHVYTLLHSAQQLRKCYESPSFYFFCWADDIFPNNETFCYNKST